MIFCAERIKTARLSAVAAAPEKPRAPQPADRQQDFEVRILFTQGGELLQIRLHLRRQPDLVQMSRILQGRIGLVFFIVIDKAKRVVEMGDLPDVQLIDITARPAVTSPRR